MSSLSISLDDQELASYLEHVFQVGFEPAKHRGLGVVSAIRSKDLPYPNGFIVEVTTSWRRVEAAFVLEPYAPLIAKSMSAASDDAKQRFSKMLASFVEQGGSVNLVINGIPVKQVETLPPPPWSSIGLDVSKLAPPASAGPDLLRKVRECCLAVAALGLTLLPLEAEHQDTEAAGLPEGAVTRIEVNKYERSSTNRAACISCFGAVCQACGFVYSDTYGYLGDGFIEVHHRVPVSTIGAGYVIDPLRDLVPLCANCHAMIHRTSPPLSVDELRTLITGRRDVGAPKK